MTKEVAELIEFSKTLNLLYVEDNEDAREQTLKLLKNFFENITVAVDGKDGLDKFKEPLTKFDIIITDINMPIMDGIEMLREIRDIDKSVQCLVLSAHDEVKLFLASIKIGIDGYMLKPIESKQFFELYSKTIKHLVIAEKSRKQKDELDAIYSYNTSQQLIAKNKVETTIVNSLESDDGYETEIIYQPLDILSGDFYSIYKLEDGSIFAYIIDGQGHGVSPALTVFSTASIIASLIPKVEGCFESLEDIFKLIRNFLSEEEQLSFSILHISPDSKTLSYSMGGMYPVLVKKGDEILKIKANNSPFMNFSDIPKIDKIDITSWSDIMLYSDGLVESEDKRLLEITPKKLLNDSSLFSKVKELLQVIDKDDDVTVLKIAKI